MDEVMPKGIVKIQQRYKYKGKEYDYEPSYIYDYYINGKRNRIHKKSFEEIMAIKNTFKRGNVNEHDVANRMFLSFIETKIPDLYAELCKDFRQEVADFTIKDSIKNNLHSRDGGEFLAFIKNELPDTFSMLKKNYEERKGENND